MLRTLEQCVAIRDGLGEPLNEGLELVERKSRHDNFGVGMSEVGAEVVIMDLALAPGVNRD